jgi:chromosome segregation ATPase
MLGSQHNNVAAKVSFLNDQLKMMKDEKIESDELAYRLELQVNALTEENSNLKTIRGPTYAQDIS